MKIIKSKRKTLILTVDKSWEVLVKSPLSTSDKKINEFVSKHKNWIEKRQKEIKEKPKTMEELGFIYFKGEKYKLKIIRDKNEYISLEDWICQIKIHKNIQNEDEYIRNILRNYLLEEANKYILPRLDYLAKRFSLDFTHSSIWKAKTKWWSCSSKRKINFSYRLICMPLEVIDYVIIHELSHLLEMNHSKKFWKVVESMMPDYHIHWDTLKKKNKDIMV